MSLAFVEHLVLPSHLFLRNCQIHETRQGPRSDHFAMPHASGLCHLLRAVRPVAVSKAEQGVADAIYHESVTQATDRLEGASLLILLQ